MKREDGFYWVKYTGEWLLAMWSGDEWVLCGSNAPCFDDNFEQIDERRIEREPEVFDRNKEE